MEIHEEYLHRRQVKAPLVKYAERASAILRSRDGGGDRFLQLQIVGSSDGSKPMKYRVSVVSNPVMVSEDRIFTTQTKPVWSADAEWDQLDTTLAACAKKFAPQYEGVSLSSAVQVAWEIWTLQNDAWLSKFLPVRLQEVFYRSLAGTAEERPSHVQAVEMFLRERYEKTFQMWRSAKSVFDQKTYAEWLVKFVNGMAA